jgi:Peptidase family M1 domain
VARARWLLLAGACVGWSAVGAQRADAPPLSGEFAVRAADSLWAAAVGRQTRSGQGTPGSRHWVQGAHYDIQARLDPARGVVSASGILRYRNRSPDTLHTLALSLAQNLFRVGAPHNEAVPITGGITVSAMCVKRAGTDTSARGCGTPDAPDRVEGLHVQHTIAWMTLSTPLLPGDSVDLHARWSFVLPTDNAPRMGSDGSVHMVGYWYPQFCVYDDVVGWQVDPYLATGEFYMDHADYDVRITVPAGTLVAATGTLRNAEAVLSPVAREQLRRAVQSFAAVPVVSDSLRRARGATLGGETLTWRFSARNVRDFAFYASKDVVWDAMAALVPRGGAQMDTVLIHALYRPKKSDWRRAADDGRQSIEHFSRVLWPYPWPQMTLVEGVVDGGMEYPMLTVISVRGDHRELLTTIAHEVGHMWFPMQVGTDERRFAWMDEGIASWLERLALLTRTGHDDDAEGVPALYRAVVGMGAEQPMLTHADHFAGVLPYTAASYEKLVVVFRAFAAEYGDSALVQGLRRFGAAWNGRHAYPEDFYRVVFAAAGAERELFVREWLRGLGGFDVSLEDVQRERDTLTVVVHSKGRAHLSVPVVITRTDGRRETVVLTAAAFRRSALQTLRIGGARSVAQIALDPEQTRPDLNRGNERWSP